jgi:hypothetical protein
MKYGAVALFDALGFRGIWRKHDVDAVLKKLQDLREGATHVVASFQKTVESLFVGTNVKPLLEVTLLSDTVIVSATVDGASDDVMHAWSSLLLASYGASAVMALGGKDAPCLAYRGCVAYGAFEIDQAFIVGPAVDEAANGEMLAEAAIVWFSPTAEAVIQSAIAKYGSHAETATPWLLWDVPMKGGAVYHTHAVTPFFSAEIQEPDASQILSPVDAATLRERILATFDDSRLDVAIKKQHTQRFLDAALEQVVKR